MNRRLSILASLLFAVAMFAFNSSASAQVDTCCARVVNNTNCHVEICVLLPGNVLRCFNLDAHDSTRFRFPCDSTTAFAVTDACGQLHRLIPGECVRVVLRGGCCAYACLRRDDDGCYSIHIYQVHGSCTCGLE